MTEARLEGRIALITGATSGIGAETARRLAQEGATLTLTGRNAERGSALIEEIGTISAGFLPADLTAAESAARLVEWTEQRWGRPPDVLVNNAALDHTGDLLETPTEAVRDIFEVNFYGALRLLQEAGLRMQAGGSIVNITSRLASFGVPTMALYAASKGALLSLTRAAAIELAPRGIRVNAVAPGMTRTPLYENWIADQRDPVGADAEVRARIPQNRLAEPADVAAAIAYLASDDAAHVTGISLPVDGGYTAD